MSPSSYRSFAPLARRMAGHAPRPREDAGPPPAGSSPRSSSSTLKTVPSFRTAQCLGALLLLAFGAACASAPRPAPERARGELRALPEPAALSLIDRLL